MGSNFWLRTASGFGLAVAMLGTVPIAQAGGLDGIKGHIDIPEIARGTGGGKVRPGHGDVIDLTDEFGGGIFDVPGHLPQDIFILPPDGGTMPDGLSLPAVGVFTPEQLLGRQSAIPVDGTGAVPAPGSILPLALAAFGLRRRRRA